MLSFTGIAGPTECVAPADAAAAPTGAPEPAAALALVPKPSYAAGDDAWYAILVLQASASAPAQAFDVDVRFTPGVVTRALAAAPATGGFGGDAALSSAGIPDLPAGRLAHVVGMRRGPATALSGNLDLAYVLIRVGGREPVWVEAQGSLARPDGKLFATAPSTRVRVQPPPR